MFFLVFLYFLEFSLFLIIHKTNFTDFLEIMGVSNSQVVVFLRVIDKEYLLEENNVGKEEEYSNFIYFLHIIIPILFGLVNQIFVKDVVVTISFIIFTMLTNCHFFLFKNDSE